MIIAVLLNLTISVWAEVGWDFTDTFADAKLGDDTVRFEFPFLVVGNDPIKFLSLDAPCGCAEMAMEKVVYGPGEHGKLVVKMLVGERVGPQRQTVVVHTDGVGDRGTELRLRTDIPTAFSMDGRLIHWRSGDLAMKKEFDFRVLPPFRLGVVKAMVAGESVSVVVSEIEPGVFYRLTVELINRDQFKPVMIRINTDHPIKRLSSFSLWALRDASK